MLSLKLVNCEFLELPGAHRGLCSLAGLWLGLHGLGRQRLAWVSQGPPGQGQEAELQWTLSHLSRPVLALSRVISCHNETFLYIAVPSGSVTALRSSCVVLKRTTGLKSEEMGSDPKYIPISLSWAQPLASRTFSVLICKIIMIPEYRTAMLVAMLQGVVKIQESTAVSTC